MSVILRQRNILTHEWLAEELGKRGYLSILHGGEGLLIPFLGMPSRIMFGGSGWFEDGATNRVYLCAITARSLLEHMRARI